jgi:hypothetical protein
MELLVSIENFEEDSQSRTINSPRTLGMFVIIRNILTYTNHSCY